MSTTKSWLSLIKRFLYPEPHHHHQHKRTNRRRIWFFGRLKETKGLLPPSPPPPPPPVEATEVPKTSMSIIASDVVSLNHQQEKDVLSLAAIKIQTAYRGYLARKALRALKGFVRLQAIIRGRAVRRQAMTTLKCLQAIVDIQSEVCTKRGQMAQDKYKGLQLQGLHHDKLKMKINTHTRLDFRLLPIEEEIDIILRKKEAILRRHGNKAQLFSHRSSTGSEQGKIEGRLRYWLEQYANNQVTSNKEHNTVPKNLKVTQPLNTLYLPRRSFHTLRKQSFYEKPGQNPRSPNTTPTYMAATESAKAKARSTSSPRPSPVIVDRAYSDGDSPYKHKLISPVSSTRSEVTCSDVSRISNKSSCSRQKYCPSLKGVPSPVRSQ